MSVVANTTELSGDLQHLFDLRATHSKTRIQALITSFAKSKDILTFPDVGVFCAGSYARLEASEYSDIDLFFVSDKEREYYADEYNVPTIRMMSEVVRIGDSLGFPKFSNDGQYLKILHIDEILNTLGGHRDDYTNNFTARLLLILESKPIYGDGIYKSVVDKILESYYRDYPDHEENFRPNFLINDIVRFWKTLCLNYENKRNQRSGSQEKKIKQKIKNFKLKFSRLLTCYASIAYMTSLPIPIAKSQVVDMIAMTPSTRLRSVINSVPAAKESINQALESYHWFLERTNVTESELFEYFSDESRRKEAFARAGQFGDHIFNVLRQIDDKNDTFRFLVI